MCLSVCVFVFVYQYMHTYLCVCVRVCINTYIHTYLCVCVCVCVSIHTYIGEEDGGDDWETSDGPMPDPGLELNPQP